MTTASKKLPKSTYVVDSSPKNTETISGKTWGGTDPTNRQWMKLISTSKSLDFWLDPEEDIYSVEDGDPV